MIGNALKLGIGAGVGYTVGGRIGQRAAHAISGDTIAADTLTAYTWGGRIATTLIAWWLLGKLGGGAS